MSAILMALDAIREKKGRSFLTMLGIIIGVCAVLVLVALVSGYNADLTAYYEKLGVNKVEVSVSFYDSTRTVELTDALYEYGNQDLGDMVTGVSPDLSSSMTLKYGENNLTTTVYLGSDQFSTCSNYTLNKGRDISQVDLDQRSKVCLLGTYTAQTLFGLADPVGKTLYINGIPFTVVGTYYQKDGSAEDSMDDMAVVPYSVNRTLLGSDSIAKFVVKVDTSEHMTTVISKVKSFLAERVDEDTIGEVTVKNGNSAMDASDEETASLSVVLGGIAAIALLVGGIGIMNIMLVTVTERTREIGIKKAIGAPRREIVTQFLVEAGVLSALGGVIGIGLGFALSLILGKAMYDLIVLPSAFVTLGSFLFSIVIGVGFGLYPAVKASGLQPVDALRAD